MKKTFILLTLFISFVITGCSSDKDNPYKETHITDVIHDYDISQPTEPILKKPISELTEVELKTRLSELQKLTWPTPAQKKELDLISERLKEITTNQQLILIKQ